MPYRKLSARYPFYSIHAMDILLQRTSFSPVEVGTLGMLGRIACLGEEPLLSEDRVLIHPCHHFRTMFILQDLLEGMRNGTFSGENDARLLIASLIHSLNSDEVFARHMEEMLFPHGAEGIQTYRALLYDADTKRTGKNPDFREFSTEGTLFALADLFAHRAEALIRHKDISFKRKRTILEEEFFFNMQNFQPLEMEGGEIFFNTLSPGESVVGSGPRRTWISCSTSLFLKDIEKALLR